MEEGLISFDDAGASEAIKSLHEVDYARVQAEMQSQMATLQLDFETRLKDLKNQMQVKLSQELSDFQATVSGLESDIRSKDNKIDQLEEHVGASNSQKFDLQFKPKLSTFDGKVDWKPYILQFEGIAARYH